MFEYQFIPMEGILIYDEVPFPHFVFERVMGLWAQCISEIISAHQVVCFPKLAGLGTHIYNKALDDAKLWFNRRMEDDEGDYYALYKQVR